MEPMGRTDPKKAKTFFIQQDVEFRKRIGGGMEEQQHLTHSSENLIDDRSQEKLKILVVEDDRTQWPLWENILAALETQLEIDWVTSAEDAQKLLRQSYQVGTCYGLVISDVFLEGVSTGVDLWNRYGEFAQNFVFVSGVPMARGTVLKELKFGEPLFLEKPIKVKEVKKILKAMTDKIVGKGAL
jgi:DNA-binding NtrC family response regulator